MPQAIDNKRWLYLIDSAVLLLFLGLVYAWSNFVKPLEVEFGWLRSQTSLAFSICMSFFCLGGFLSGAILRRHTTRPVMYLCAVCVSSGFLLASRLTSLTGLYVTYGVLVGLGIGFGYNCTASTIVKWFPEKPGFVSGLTLMGFGLGGMALGTVSTAMITSFGWRSTFFQLGIVFAVLIVFCSFFIKTPPRQQRSSASAAEGGEDVNVTTIQMIKRPSFQILFSWGTLVAAAGLALIGNASSLAIDMGSSVETASFLTGLVSIFNGAGRVIVGFLYDKIGRKKSMCVVSLSLVAAFASIIFALKGGNFSLLIAGYVCLGFSFGGIAPINNAVCYAFYGSENYAMNISIINFHLIISSFLGPFLAGSLQTMSGSFIGAAVVMALFGVASLVLSFLLKKA
ncbi:MAG: OFA family MFS transporter [Synergistaceae bacterium]|nr:OFA family MFS transporter [Synergistaceae bacterium]